jgi:NADPH2:quinone reductase
MEARLDLLKVLMRRLTISGNTLRARSIKYKQAIAHQLVERVWPLLEDGRIKPEIYASFAPGAAHEAHRLMESNQHIGKIVIDWSK